MLNSILFCSLIIFLIQNITGEFAKGDCSSYITSGSVTYKGCKQSITTESLVNPPSPRSNIHVFKGMRFAEPPLGHLRFAKPVPLVYSVNISKDATNYGASCMQPMLDLDNVPMSEDCLYINICTPTLNSSANLPVMFYIHGGVFQLYSGKQFNGSQLALRDVVVVTFNYRLGVFGFLYGNRSDAPGNAGLWDQALALQWTIDNIRAFGGDPNQITVFGQSAGSSGYQKIFNRDPDFAYKTSHGFSMDPSIFPISPCIDDNYWIDCLKGKDASVLLSAEIISIAFKPSTLFYSSLLPQFVPMFGDFDNFMPISIPQAVREGNFRRDVNLLIGHNEMEGARFAQHMSRVLFLSSRYNPKICPTAPFIPLFPKITKDIASKDINSYFLNKILGSTPGQKYTETFSDYDVMFKFEEKNRIRSSAVHALGDFLLTCPTIIYGYYIAKFQVLTKKVLQYRLTYADSISGCYGSCWANATHGDDVRLVFGDPFSKSGINADDKDMSSKIMDIWTTFAKTDELPTVNGKAWPAYIASPGLTNLSYVELHPSPTRFGRIFSDRYDGVNDGFTPNVINNCLYFWDDILFGQY